MTTATPTKPKTSLPYTSTPVKKSSQGSEHYTTLSEVDAETLKKNMATELAGQWVGPMPVDKFLSTFLPNSDQKPEFDPMFFNVLKEQTLEVKMYDPFIKLVTEEAPEIIKGFKLVNTSQHDDSDITIPGMKNKPDVSCYQSTQPINPAHPTRYEDIELIFEFKPKRDEADPFEDKPGYHEIGNRFPFEAQADARKKCRGQIAGYSRVWCARQHRTHCFIIWIADPHARLIRIDRSGGIVSQRFDYRQNGDLLLHFLWNFCRSTDSARGLDETVTKASAAETVEARKTLSKWRTTSTRSVFKIQVPNPEGGPEKEMLSYLVWGPLADPRSMTGRATRGYAAWDIAKGRIVFLKDSWRSTEPGMEKEVDILRELKEKQCRHVPEVVCGDDLKYQTTETKKFATETWNIGARQERLIQRSHTRFVEKDVGSHIASGELKNMTPRKFLQIVFHAFIAHYDAYRLCGILHRDISAGNILVKENGEGFLNDWDLSRHVNLDIGPRQAFRSGTWQFMSSELLRDPRKVNTLQDDLESFFWLVLYHILRFMNHNHAQNLGETMKTIFDSEVPVGLGEEPKGGETKSLILVDGGPLGRKFEVVGNPALTVFYRRVRGHFEDWLAHIRAHGRKVDEYEFNEDVSPEIAAEKFPLNTENLALHNHLTVFQLFEDALSPNAQSRWCASDCFVDRFPEPTPTTSTAIKRGAEELEDVAQAGEGQEADVDARPKKTPRRVLDNNNATRTPTKMNQVESYDSPQV